MNPVTTLRRSLAVAVALVAAGPVLAQDSGPIVAEGVVEAPVDAVWNAWATGEDLRPWFAPASD